ncbi:hypothetical protein SAMN04487894_1262 [Niabella drilacis]|uniref:Natural product n=1 Tax=Niabella drilacis (strain DSM 25811 / CCM 8410 / CCUG 62505 / LMG 26954 / E90) TaxID=1285928 RepID=A0A1G7AYE5_NIADE|nr:hypothetical protein SAMN04487894_1262 [Niabella drilacis]
MMKKLKLSLQNVEGAQVLTRAQLKRVIEGSDSGSAPPPCKDECTQSPCTYYDANAKSGNCK